MRICIAEYEHKHGTDIRAFDAEDGALAWRTEIAKENWESQFPGKDVPGEDLIADEYFALLGERTDIEESFSNWTIDLESADGVDVDLGLSEPTLTVPTVHMNGTPRERLLSQVQDAGEAVRKALDALANASPNARDYYPQGVAAYPAAVGEHDRRCKALRKVYEELAKLSEAIDAA